VLDTERRLPDIPDYAKNRSPSRPDKLQNIDGRLAEAQLMARVRRELTQHLGGKPTAPQRILIDRVAALSLRLHLMDRDSARSDGMSERNSRQYLAWSNSLTRALNQIGLNAAPAAKSTPQATRPFWEELDDDGVGYSERN